MGRVGSVVGQEERVDGARCERPSKQSGEAVPLGVPGEHHARRTRAVPADVEDERALVPFERTRSVHADVEAGPGRRTGRGARARPDPARAWRRTDRARRCADPARDAVPARDAREVPRVVRVVVGERDGECPDVARPKERKDGARRDPDAVARPGVQEQRLTVGRHGQDRESVADVEHRHLEAGGSNAGPR